MKIIGLTGTIAAGKSTVARMFKRQGLFVHDADRTVHELLSPGGAGTEQVIAEFGSQLKNKDGSVNRPALGHLVFSDHHARKKLESILHPMVHQRRKQFIARMNQLRQNLVVLDVPLLFETGSEGVCDYVVTVWAPMFILRQRALRRANMTSEKFNSIVSTQLPQSDKTRLSDLALPTGLSQADTYHRLKRWLCHIRASNS